MGCDFFASPANHVANEATITTLNYSTRMNTLHKHLFWFITMAIHLHLPSTALAQSQQQMPQDTSAVFAEALRLIDMPEPRFEGPFSEVDRQEEIEHAAPGTPCTFTTRDGKNLYAERFGAPASTTILALHGVGANNSELRHMAQLLHEATQAEVITLDWRGHGQSDGVPGDVNYADQYADDLADVVLTLRDQEPDNTLMIAAHSMGGGITLRYALRHQEAPVDGYVLFAPLLGSNAPTQRQGPANPDAEPFMNVHIPRLIGLYMMNSIGNHDYDTKPVIFLNRPADVLPNQYSYRSFASMAPEEYKKGLQALTAPLLVLVGSEDEAFIAEAYVPAVTENSDGQVHIIDGATHNGIREHLEAIQAVSQFAQTIVGK